MAHELWHYAENQFDNVTKNSKRRMNIISADHLSKLEAEQSDADIHGLFHRFEPLRAEYVARYDSWLKARGIYKGATQKMDELQETLNEEQLPGWDNKIKVAVGEGSADYTTILPKGRGAFRAARDQTIREVAALAERLANFPDLAAVKTEVETFAAQMEQTRDIQQQKEGLVDNASDALEEQRVICARMMYANLGRLMDKFADAPENIERFFELQVIQQHVGASEEEQEEEEEVEPIPPEDEPPVE